MNEIVSAVEFVTSRPCPVIYCPRRPVDVAELVADPTRAQDLLQWKPRKSLPQIIAGAWEWFQRHHLPVVRQDKRISERIGT